MKTPDMAMENNFLLREAAKAARMGYYDHLSAGGKGDPAEERWIEALMAGADAITQVTVLESRLAQAERERDAAVESVSGYCSTCAFLDDCSEHDRNDCLPSGARWYYGDCEDWEWRGACSENTKEDA